MPAFSFFDPTTWPTMAPNALTQSILPGWSFFTVNETNSSAPDAEQRIVSKDSYGKQLGKLTDAVAELIALSGKTTGAFTDVLDLQARVEQAKAEARVARLKTMMADLQALKASDPQAFKDLIDGV